MNYSEGFSMNGNYSEVFPQKRQFQQLPLLNYRNSHTLAKYQKHDFEF